MSSDFATATNTYDPISANPRVAAALSESLAGHDQAEFKLWLAMFSSDVTEQPQIQEQLPPIHPNWQRALGAAQARPLAPPISSTAGSANASAAWQKFGLTSLSDWASHQLNDALHPQPLTPLDDSSAIPLHVFQNLDWQTRRREQQRQATNSDKSRTRRYSEADLGEIIEQSDEFLHEFMQEPLHA